VSINAGGDAVGAFLADGFYSGGSTFSTSTAIDTSALSGDAPSASVFQTERYGEFTYTIPDRAPGTPQTVILYFEESYWTSSGQRTFDVAINGSTVLTAFDIYAAAGGTGKAVAKTFTAAADSSGQVAIRFVKSGADNPKVCAITVSGEGSTPSGSSSSSSSSSSGGTSGSSSGALAKFVGNITTRGAVRSDFARFWNQITPENEGKWGSVQPREGEFNWQALDAIYKYANDNNIVFKEHTFVWGAQQPPWVNNGNARTAVRAWMKAFCERYPNTRIIDVVNEPPPHTTPVYKDGMGGDGASGYDWIVNAFKWAREFCPNAILLLNDYNNIELDGDTAHTIDIVKRIKAAGAPIDGVGCQAHGTAGSSAASLRARIDRLASETGLPVYITEFDLSIKDDGTQRDKMEEHFTMFWNNPNIKGITLWGYVHGATWVPDSGLIREDGSFRPAMTWLTDFLSRK
jgi:endo-1,4-beta-xylanase